MIFVISCICRWLEKFSVYYLIPFNSRIGLDIVYWSWERTRTFFALNFISGILYGITVIEGKEGLGVGKRVKFSTNCLINSSAYPLELKTEVNGGISGFLKFWVNLLKDGDGIIVQISYFDNYWRFSWWVSSGHDLFFIL